MVSTVRRQDSGEDTMSEERTQYTVHPDVLVRLETSEKHIKQLENTLNGYAMIQGRHAAMIAERDARIAELEATVQRLRNERLLEYTVPVTLLRYIVNSHPHLPVDDRITARRWLDTVKVTP